VSGPERIGFTMRLLPGKEAEYRSRHEAVWPDLLADLRAAGARNYSIFQRGDDLFAYLEVEDFDRFTRHMAGSEANARWQADMAGLIDPLTDPATGFHRRIPEVFHLE
jgi:L-rhamnose mutarotase